MLQVENMPALDSLSTVTQELKLRAAAVTGRFIACPIWRRELQATDGDGQKPGYHGDQPANITAICVSGPFGSEAPAIGASNATQILEAVGPAVEITYDVT